MNRREGFSQQQADGRSASEACVPAHYWETGEPKAGLEQMLESTGAKFDPETLSIVRDERKYCAKCESEMVLRTAKKGSGAGSQFWGCSTYPRCKFTMLICTALS